MSSNASSGADAITELSLIFHPPANKVMRFYRFGLVCLSGLYGKVLCQ